MIRLGSLAGYSFEGPRVLAGWTPPPTGGVYAIFYPDQDRPGSERLAVCYVGHTDDFTAAGFPFRHPKADCWIARAGGKFRLKIATFEMPGGTAAHREQITQELVAVYHPSCNEQQYDQAWERHWIGDYEAPNITAPLATGLAPHQSRREPRPDGENPA